MNKVLDATIDVLKKNNNWMTTREIFSRFDKRIWSHKKQQQLIAEIGSRITQNKELFEIDKSQRPQRIRLKQSNDNIQYREQPEQSEEDSQKFSFNFEQDLKRHIVTNLEEIEQGLKLHPNGMEFPTDIGRIDILAIDKDNDFVVIELKAGLAGDKALGQILGYMAWVKKNLAKDRNVRGLIISNNIEDRLKYGAMWSNHVQIKKYEVHFSFHSISP